MAKQLVLYKGGAERGLAIGGGGGVEVVLTWALKHFSHTEKVWGRVRFPNVRRRGTTKFY